MSDAVVCESLAIGYDGRSVVSGLNLTVKQGEALLLLGHNGSGKSTLLKTLFSLLAPVGGGYRLPDAGADVASPARLLRRGVRYLGQGVRSFDFLPVAQSRRVLAELYGCEAADPAALGLGAPSPRVRVGNLSVGQRRLEALALLSAGRPRLLLLDEPMAGLDRNVRATVARWVAHLMSATGASFVIAEHEFAELLPAVQQALVLKGGVVTFLGPANTLADSKALAAAYL